MQTPAQQTYSKINKLIDSSRLNESFNLLKTRMPQFKSLEKDLEKLKTAENTYKYLLDYIADGKQDPSLDEMLGRLKEDLYHANDALLRENYLIDSSDMYSSLRRMFNLKQTGFQTLLDEYIKISEETFKGSQSENGRVLTVSQARSLNEIFNYVWTLYGNEISEYELIGNSFDDPELPEYFKVILVSALILGNLSYYNPETFNLLLNIYDTSESTIVRARSVVGIVLISLLYSNRIAGNLKLRSRLILSSEDEDFKKLVKEVLYDIIRTYDTKRIDNKMRNEVIPGLMKLKPEILDKMRNIASDSENFLSEGNPEWEDIIEKSDIGKKLQEINNLQMEGADVMVTAFSNLKGFPFFSNVSNWFMPFIPGHYEFASLPLNNDDKTIDRFTTVMCDSDLHSFLLSLSSMPDDKKTMMISNMQAQMKEAYEALSNSIGETESQKTSKQIRHYLQDLYRFFKFYRKKNEFEDPFNNPFLRSHFEPLQSFLGIDNDTIRLIGEFYFKNKYYEEAIGFFELYNKFEPDNFNIWEKIGFAYDQSGRYEDAVTWYKKADLVNPNNTWLEKKLAVALKNTGEFNEALEYYNKSLESDPDNFHLIMSAGQCLLACKKPKEALKHFYHAQYLKPEKMSPSRAVAWTELLSNNYEKAISQYEKILNNPEANKTDFLNAGHAYLASGNFPAALRQYRKFVDYSENENITELVIAFRDDSQTMKELGIKTSDMRLIIDKLRYDISSNPI